MAVAHCLPTGAVMEVLWLVKGVEGGEVHISSVANVIGHNIQDVVEACRAQGRVRLGRVRKCGTVQTMAE